MKPCPFCASTDVWVESWAINSGDRHLEYAVSCRNCGGSGPNDLGKSGAVEMWDMRRTEFPKPYTGDGFVEFDPTADSYALE